LIRARNGPPLLSNIILGPVALGDRHILGAATRAFPPAGRRASLTDHMNEQVDILARRLGTTVHESVLRRKLLRLSRAFPSPDAGCLEDWLVDVANARGARVVVRTSPPSPAFVAPPASTLANEDLVVGICHLQGLDRPQMLRLAAQLISRGAVDVRRLQLAARRERVGRVLAELARQALRVDPAHIVWRSLFEAFGELPRLREPLLHWSRLAEPVMRDGRINAACWRLVA
jgi:hypothetical protein